MKQSESIHILRPQEEVFDLVTNPDLAPAWNGSIHSVDILTGGPWEPGSQAIWVTEFGSDKLEYIETAIECVRPKLTASTYEFIRFVPPTPEEIRKEGLPRINYEYELHEQFQTMFGKYRPTGIIVNEFLPADENTTVLRITDDLEIGGLAGFLSRMAIIFRRKPLKKTLKLIKSTIENIDKPGPQQSEQNHDD